MDENSENNQSSPQIEELAQTAPENLSISLREFDTEDHARQFANLVALCVRKLSECIDLSTLDGITIADDYLSALHSLDRGYETTYKLTPTTDIAWGVAMTPSVMREGKIRSHMVFNANVLLPLEDPNHELFARALHTLAHECAHVEVTAAFDSCFPGVLLQKGHRDFHDAFRRGIVTASWDEYAATRICARIGHDPTEEYEQTFLTVLCSSREKANECIKAYRLHADLERIIREVYESYGNLLKFACYHIGNMRGLELSLDDLPNTKKALDGHWFKSFWPRLIVACEMIWADFGRWQNEQPFEAFGNLVDEIVKDGGLYLTHLEDGTIYADLPFTPDTLPINT
jgi:hypothetical protein